MCHRRSESGQATVEFAVVLPAVVIVLLLVFQALVLGRGYLAVAHAAREAARAAAVDPSGREATDALTRSLPGADLEVVRTEGRAPSVRATVRFRVVTSLPFVGALLPDPVVSSSVVMRAEQ